MFWLRLFWLEAIVIPGVLLWLLSRRSQVPYRGINLALWGMALVSAIAGFMIVQQKKRARTALSKPTSGREGQHGSPTH